jgi:aminoglycoside phosphotransferase (APT) family kinase protein
VTDRDATIGPDLARTLIERQFPALVPADVAYLGEGCDSTAFEVNGTWVFRFPKRRDVEAQLLLERRLLPHLARSSPVAVPVFRHLGEASPEFPLSFAGYRKLDGVTALQARIERPPAGLALALGRFLSFLHTFPVEVARQCGVPDEDASQALDDIRAEAVEDFATVRELAPGEPLDRWFAFLRAGVDLPDARRSTSCLLHNDLAAEHVLVDRRHGTATGVIDWSDAALGDPVMDFAGIFHWGGDRFADGVLAAYDRDFTAADAGRARFAGACRGVGDVVFGRRFARPEYIAGGLRALRQCVR